MHCIAPPTAQAMSPQALLTARAHTLPTHLPPPLYPLLLPLLPAGVLLVALRTGDIGSINLNALPAELDSREQAFVRRALQQDWRLRPAASALTMDPYIYDGPEGEAAALMDKRFSRLWGNVHATPRCY
jgi:hypothetical protein